MNLISRRRWYYREQLGRCYLMVTPSCKSRGGDMLFDKSGKSTPKAYATWDHTFPREHRRDNEGRYQLLACYGCNNRRGSQPPSAEIIARAQTLFERWAQFQAMQNAEMEERRQRRKQRKAQRRLIREMQRAVNA